MPGVTKQVRPVKRPALPYSQPVFSEPAIDRLKSSRISRIIVTDTVPLPPEKQIPKIESVSVAKTFADAIRASPPGTALTECLRAALAAAEVAMTPQLRAAAARRILVVAANSELQERGLLKHARIIKSITAALRERGTEELTARLGAEMSMLAFSVAFERWMKANDDEPFPPFADAALSDLQARAAELVLPMSPLPSIG